MTMGTVYQGLGKDQSDRQFYRSCLYENIEGCSLQENPVIRSPLPSDSESCMGIRSVPSMVAPGVRKISHLPTIGYRPIRPSDLEVLKEIHKALFPIRYESEFFLNVVNGRGIVSWAAVDTSRPDAHRDDPIGFVTARVVVATESETEDMLGYDILKTDRTLVYILTLGVINPYRNLGIASRLVWEVIEYASSIPSCRAVYLHVISYNQSAILFYKKNNFQCLRKLQNFYYINGYHYDAYLYVYYVNGGRAPCSALDFLAAVGTYVSKLPRSNSSPSPPSTRNASGRADSSRRQFLSSRPAKRHLGPFGATVAAVQPDHTNMELSSTYHAGSSSDQSSSETAEEDSDDEPHGIRGRRSSQKGLQRDVRDAIRRKRHPSSPSKQTYSSTSIDYTNDGKQIGSKPRRMSFTRSRSPHPRTFDNLANATHPPSGASSFPQRHKLLPVVHTLLPATIAGSLSLPRLGTWTFCMDTRYMGESLLLIGSLAFFNKKLSVDTHDIIDASMSAEIYILLITATLYIIRAHTLLPHAAAAAPTASESRRTASPRTEAREIRRTGSQLSPTIKPRFSFIWMSVPKNYRESPNDGVLTGLLLPPMIALALLYSALRQVHSPTSDPNLLPPHWLIEAPSVLHNPRSPDSAIDALIQSRRGLVDYSTMCSFILLAQVCSSWIIETRYRGRPSVPEGERGSVPRSEMRRTWLYVLFTFGMTMLAITVRYLFALAEIPIWRNISYLDIGIGSLFYQLCLYSALRLAHGGFTLGELALVCFGGLSLATELLGLTRARIWPKTAPFIETYRLPTPLLIFQIALIAGSFITGFLLSPLLALSRHIAQRPVRRLRLPQEKQRHRRALAAGFYIGTIIIVVGLIGSWTWWNLGRRNPWLWTILWLLEGRKKWSRPMLLAYWGLLGSISVAGWNRQLSRSRRYRHRNTSGGTQDNVIVPFAANPNQKPQTEISSSVPTTLGLTFPNLANLPNLSNGSQVATELLDAADKHVPTLGINARRKFFHALAVVMFLPGVAVDPAFTHLSFSAAFALFIFAEYVRYFAIYPFGAAVHLFMNEFLEQKDSGTAILSHFYLLTGCAGPLWLEEPSQLLQYTGILALGIGDALASIIGKRIGRHRWSSTSSKTLEGSAAFVLSLVGCAWLLRLCGLTEEFSTLRYSIVVTLSCALEALSDQNDNLTLPLYMWSLLVAVDV